MAFNVVATHVKSVNGVGFLDLQPVNNSIIGANKNLLHLSRKA